MSTMRGKYVPEQGKFNIVTNHFVINTDQLINYIHI